MFDIGFTELALIFVIGLVVLGPKKLPIAIRTVVSWIRTLRGIATNVQNELAQELKLQELQESISKIDKLDVSKLSPDLADQIEELKKSANELTKNAQEQASEIEKDLKAASAIEAAVHESEQIGHTKEDEIAEQVELAEPHELEYHDDSHRVEDGSQTASQIKVMNELEGKVESTSDSKESSHSSQS